MKHDSKPHGERPFTYHPHKLTDPKTYAENYDRIFRKTKTESPKTENKQDHVNRTTDR
jgi:hypothetical protein